MFNYDDIGSKLKGLAQVGFVLESISSIILGIVLIVGSFKSGGVIPGILVAVFGPVFAWISSWVIYGIGEAAEGSGGSDWSLTNLEQEINQLKDQVQAIGRQQGADTQTQATPKASDWKEEPVKKEFSKESEKQIRLNMAKGGDAYISCPHCSREFFFRYTGAAKATCPFCRGKISVEYKE